MSNVNSEIIPNQELAEELQKQLLENLNSERCTHLLKIIFGVLTKLIYN